MEVQVAAAFDIEDGRNGNGMNAAAWLHPDVSMEYVVSSMSFDTLMDSVFGKCSQQDTLAGAACTAAADPAGHASAPRQQPDTGTGQHALMQNEPGAGHGREGGKSRGQQGTHALQGGASTHLGPAALERHTALPLPAHDVPVGSLDSTGTQAAEDIHCLGAAAILDSRAAQDALPGGTRQLALVGCHAYSWSPCVDQHPGAHTVIGADMSCHSCCRS
jgi:hypothetical protein